MLYRYRYLLRVRCTVGTCSTGYSNRSALARILAGIAVYNMAARSTTVVVYLKTRHVRMYGALLMSELLRRMQAATRLTAVGS